MITNKYDANIDGIELLLILFFADTLHLGFIYVIANLFTLMLYSISLSEHIIIYVSILLLMEKQFTHFFPNVPIFYSCKQWYDEYSCLCVGVRALYPGVEMLGQVNG